MRILKLLYVLGSLNVSDIARRLDSNFASISEHLKILTTEGILQEHTYGRVRMYRFNETSARAKAVKSLIEAWEQNN